MEFNFGPFLQQLLIELRLWVLEAVSEDLVRMPVALEQKYKRSFHSLKALKLRFLWAKRAE
jgi:hypothetical protein